MRPRETTVASRRFAGALAITALPILGALAFTAACGGASATSLCDAVCACEGCTEGEYDACVERFEEAEVDADVAGCGTEFSDHASCVEDELHCSEGRARADTCRTAAAALYECGVSVTLGGGACDRLVAELAACGGGHVSPGGSSCSDAAEEIAACLLATGEDLCTQEGNTAASEICG